MSTTSMITAFTARDTPIWKLEAALKCRSCRKGRYAPPVHMIKLTETREITPYRWVHPDDGGARLNPNAERMGGHERAIRSSCVLFA